MVNLNQINYEIEKLLPIYTDFLSQLVKINSHYGHEREAQLLVKSKMEELSLNVAEYYSRDDDQSINLVSRFKGTDSSTYKSLILNAHCDVAQVDGIDRWSVNPFSGNIVNRYLYGRGSQDDKAGITILLLIFNVLKNINIRLKGDLLIESVIEDETTGNGSKVLVEHGYLADGVIICDGTWSERIIYAHLGQLWVDIEIRGEPVAACVPTRGKNPIYIAMALIHSLKTWIEELNASGDSFEGIEQPYLINVGSLHSGVWPGAVPADAKMAVQIGFPDRYTPDDIFNKINTMADNISDRIVIKKSLLQVPAYQVNRNNQLITKLTAIIRENSGREAKIVPVTGHCDMRHFKTENICLYGPGGGKNAHSIDEYYDLEQMPIVTKNIIDFVLQWCNEAR